MAWFWLGLIIITVKVVLLIVLALGFKRVLQLKRLQDGAEPDFFSLYYWKDFFILFLLEEVIGRPLYFGYEYLYGTYKRMEGKSYG